MIENPELLNTVPITFTSGYFAVGWQHTSLSHGANSRAYGSSYYNFHYVSPVRSLGRHNVGKHLFPIKTLLFVRILFNVITSGVIHYYYPLTE